MATLQGQQINNTYPGLIKTNDEAAIDGTLKNLQDGAGNDLPIQVSSTEVNFTGTVSGVPAGPQGPQGPEGPQGIEGPQGPEGPQGAGQVVSVVAGTNVTVDATDPANPIVSATGGGGGATFNYPSRNASTGLLGTSNAGPYTFFNNIVIFNTVYLKKGEQVSALEFEVTTDFTVNVNMSLFDSQVSTSYNTGSLVARNQIVDFGTLTTPTIGLKQLTGTTYTAEYTGFYFIATWVQGVWDGAFRDMNPRLDQNSEYVDGTSRGFGSTGDPVTIFRPSTTGLNTSYPPTGPFQSSTADIMINLVVDQTII